MSEWIYKSTAKKRYKLTDNQIRLAIEKGIVRYKQVKNPHYSTAPPAILLNVEDIENKIDEIRKFPKYSDEEREKMRYYRERSLARKNLEFYCPRCKKTIRPQRDSSTFESFWEGMMDKDRALRTLMIAHYRHVHTDYENVPDEDFLSDEERMELEHCYRMYRESHDKWEREDWLERLRNIRSIGHERKREYFNKIAIELLKEDGLI